MFVVPVTNILVANRRTVVLISFKVQKRYSRRCGMNERFSTGTEDRIRRLEITLKLVVGGSLLSWVAFALYTTTWRADAQTPNAPQSLRVSELVVTDPQGVERVRISGDLPDAVINGKRVPRGEKAAGVLLYDGTGQERGGYVTFEPSSNVALTLDTKKRQTALFAAGPDSGSALVMWSGQNNLDLRSDEDGARITMTKDGQLFQQQPQIERLSDRSCKDYKDIGSRSGKDRANKACGARFSDKACAACLVDK
jgi:hypothetical protein